MLGAIATVGDSVGLLVRGAVVSGILASEQTNEHPAQVDVTGFGYQGARKTFRLFALPTISTRPPMDFSFGGDGFRQNTGTFTVPDPLFSWNTGYVVQSPAFGTPDVSAWPEGAPIVQAPGSMQFLLFRGQTNDLTVGRDLLIRGEKYMTSPIGARWDKLREASESAIATFNAKTTAERRGNVVDYIVVPSTLFQTPALPAGPGVPQRPQPAPGAGISPAGFVPIGPEAAGFSIPPFSELLKNPALIVGLGLAAGFAVQRLRRK